MVVGHVVRAAFGGLGSNELSFEVNRFDGGFDEAGSMKCGADGLRAVSQLQPARACFEQERREHEEVLAAHESDLDVCVPPQDPLEVWHGGHPAESAAEDDNAHVPSRIACNSPFSSDAEIVPLEIDLVVPSTTVSFGIPPPYHCVGDVLRQRVGTDRDPSGVHTNRWLRAVVQRVHQDQRGAEERRAATPIHPSTLIAKVIS
jgi:hypothetical protein